ncbi:hypothetical protein TNCV_737451 [Trichonephila clavipes]|nr:hypothetical protein TNCV_737451 [Trichonephila clavipes]
MTFQPTFNIWLMPPVWRSQNEAHEIHRGKGLRTPVVGFEHVTVRIGSTKFPKGTIDGDTTYLHNLDMELKGREIFSSPLHS